MSIKNSDVKLFESQRLTDEEDGGGRATGNEVIDGNVNNLFQDISRIDRTIGDVALRKAYVGISTDNNDAYLGSHLILTEPPKDENVSVLLFNTDDQTDERSSARNRIEAYVVPGTSASFELLGNQQEGQRSIAGIQREESKLPEVGEVYRLYDPTTKKEQYVRLTNVESRLEVFTYQYGNDNFVDFERRRIDMEISSALVYTFPGGIPTPGGTRIATDTEGVITEKTVIQSTQIADASRYYGIKPTSADINKGDLSVRVQSVYESLVPSARVESPVVDQYGGYTAKRMVATSSAIRSVTPKFVHLTGNQSRAFLQTGALPGSITLSMGGGSFTDDGKGYMAHSGGTNTFSEITINYENGEINAYRNSGYFSSTASATYKPAAAIVGSAISGMEDVPAQNRGFNYTFNFAEAKPKPGTLTISYMALGKWQDVSDSGSGQLEGSGKGNIDFSTGSVAVTFDAVPDPDSKLVFSYITQATEDITLRTGSLPVEQFAFRHTTEKPGIKPGSVIIRYLANDLNRTLTDQGNGLLSGDGSGSVYYASGELGFVLNAIPDNGTEIEIEYQEGEVAGGQVEVTVDPAGLMTGIINGAPLLPGSVQIQFAVERESVTHNGAYVGFIEYTSTYNRNKTFSDNAQGGWQNGAGTIDYQTGEFTIQATENYTVRKTNAYSYIHSFQSWGVTTSRTIHTMASANVTKAEVYSGSTVTSKAQSNTLSHLPNTEALPSPELTIDLLPLIEEPLIPGSLIFEWNGESYFDRDGLLYKNISTETNAGTQVGTIDYTGGVATMTVYPSGTVGNATLTSAATFSADFKTNSVAFRTPGAPVRAGSLQLTAIRADNADILTGTADFNGDINTSEMQGYFDATTGWCEVFFRGGHSPENDPIQIIPQSVRYNCVIETSLPMDADLIGLDPVRLPSDGRVPIYRPGDIVVISHKQQTDVATPTAGQNVVLARDHQAEITVQDFDGNDLDPAQFNADKQAGTLTFADPLQLQDIEGNNLTAPFTITDRVEHMSVVSDAQINGELSIIAPVPWDLPAGETTVSSALVYGDLQARVHHFFSQKVWDNGNPNWTDERNEDNTTAQYNTINYPIQVANRGAIYGKWALIFTSGASFQVVEEKLGIIETGNTATNTAPMNPETGTPYFSILADGWGTGWAAGNVVRFNTDGCLAPVWICRTVLSGQGTESDDKFTLQIRGDAD
ncbi:hypothetical protein GZ77_04710 [Endozoicomonas montiporae]|uniref:DUF4815 domain-containing protein n=2 Tax=Endozoicomonas montiporae TaxID=1027273 RepID=A0A081NBK3_9GAMM|nr:hypothetical protein [Endozoicomonas montiporae]AMO56115.1 hypothetical protein EZMO1_1992 [Endozoicomonas montiporae CL-33]KEQ15826.1 hypothetical protein GZ77_04710 [Endozoicomonas montiporae]